jgi:hypothetical protein
MILPKQLLKHIYHYTTARETVICNSDGVIGDRVSHQQE